MGPLGKPPASLARLPSRTSSCMHSCPALLELQGRYLYCEQGNGQQETSSRNLKGFRKINNNHYKHKTQSLVINNHPYPKHRQKYWRRQNIGADKILAETKYWRRQKYWRRHARKHLLTVWLGRVYSSWLLPDLAEDLLLLLEVLIPLDADAKCDVVPGSHRHTAPHTVPPGHTCRHARHCTSRSRGPAQVIKVRRGGGGRGPCRREIATGKHVVLYTCFWLWTPLPITLSILVSLTLFSRQLGDPFSIKYWIETILKFLLINGLKGQQDFGFPNPKLLVIR
jgi:hypothetical protein